MKFDKLKSSLCFVFEELSAKLTEVGLSIGGHCLSNSLPDKLTKFLRRLNGQYKLNQESELSNLMSMSRFLVVEDTTYDNWNGGTTGHDVFFYLPLEELVRIDIDEQADLTSRICNDLNKLNTSIENEFFNAVHFEIRDEDDVELANLSSLNSVEPIDANLLSIWKPGLVRLFISHRDQYKAAANDLAETLEGFGVSSFVAHDTIQPMSEWRKEIMKGLESMEVMLVFLTDDFHESTWTNQEVGFALGKRIPIISLKLERKDPPGFISHEQALKGDIADPSKSAGALFSLIGSAVDKKDRLQEALIASFVASPSYTDAISRFDRMSESVENLSESQLIAIATGFYDNDQLHGCVYLCGGKNRLRLFLERCTSKEIEINGRSVKIADPKKYSIDGIPF